MSIVSQPLFERILSASPFSARELETLILTAPHRYKDHFIEKRNGRGKRLISQPTAEVKFLQRYLVRAELESLPVHPAATAYRSNVSIKSHATPHANARYLLKTDFRDFFPSLTARSIKYRLAKDAELTEWEQWIICQLLCRMPVRKEELQLSIGAPSSPFISNYLLWEFDRDLASFCEGIDARYTRYADDIAISTSHPHSLDIIYAEIVRLIDVHAYLGVALNTDKTVNVSRKNSRTLVGLVLANDGSVSIGRDQKRRLRATMHRLTLGQLPPEEVARLRGQLAFVLSIDPDFVNAICARHNFSDVGAIRMIVDTQ
jgi:hypothetical protein